MLFLSLACSAMLLVIACVIAHPAVRRLGPWPLGIFIVCALGFSLGPPLTGLFFLPPVAVLAPLLVFTLLPSYVWPGRWWLSPVLSVVAAAATFGVAGWPAWEEQREFARLREEVPYQSFEDRLPEPRPALPRKPLPEGTAQRLDRLEEAVASEENRYRTKVLRRLHEDTVGLFVDSPGFGVARLIRPSRDDLTRWLRPDEPVSQPVPPPISAEASGRVSWEPRPWEEDLYGIHCQGVVNFVNADRFGFVKDRRHVTGFRAHQFTYVPGSAERWEVQTLDLVGLLLHDQPLAYVSAHLPRMDELREAPTRSLDGFEASGLERLRRGEDLVVGAAPGRLRMLGAVRSTKQCVTCHGGERGDLLGAFSYTLRPSEREAGSQR
jgi:hypothetical protein